MNVQQRKYQIQFLQEWVKRVRVSRVKIYTNVLVCGLIFYLGLRFKSPGLAIPSMAFVQSVNLPEMVSAYQEAKRDTRIEKQQQGDLDQYR